MKPDEVNKDMAGKRCKCIFTGLMVTGTIEEICIGDLTADVKVRFDEPHVWGKETFNSDWSIGRFFDNTGNDIHQGILVNVSHYMDMKFRKIFPFSDGFCSRFR